MAENERKIVVEFGSDPQKDDRDLNWKGADQQRQDNGQPKQSVLNFKNLVQNGYAYNAGRQIFTTATGRIGSYTGNYILQNQVNNILAGVSIIGGLASGNPTAVISGLIQIGTTIADFNVKISQANVEASSIQQLTGISTASRSRGRGARL
jgi:hypothetical protein